MEGDAGCHADNQLDKSLTRIAGKHAETEEHCDNSVKPKKLKGAGGRQSHLRPCSPTSMCRLPEECTSFLALPKPNGVLSRNPTQKVHLSHLSISHF